MQAQDQEDEAGNVVATNYDIIDLYSWRVEQQRRRPGAKNRVAETFINGYFLVGVGG